MLFLNWFVTLGSVTYYYPGCHAWKRDLLSKTTGRGTSKDEASGRPQREGALPRRDGEQLDREDQRHDDGGSGEGEARIVAHHAVVKLQACRREVARMGDVVHTRLTFIADDLCQSVPVQ